MPSVGKVRIFSYGLLKPEYDMPKDATEIRHDSVRGRIYDLKKDAAIVDVGDPKAPWSRGVSYLVDKDTLAKIDRSELPEYRRVSATTWSGDKVQVYVYDRDIPPSAREVKNWTLSEKYRGLKGWSPKAKG